MLQPLAMPVLGAYQTIRASRALAVTIVAPSRRTALEAIADVLLAPVRYAFGGRRATLSDGGVTLEPSFRYERLFGLALGGSLLLTPIALVAGGLARALSLVSAHARARRHDLARALATMPPPPPRPVATLHDATPPAPSNAPARPPHERPNRRQARELEALRLIVSRLEAAGVVHWIDCGTALGAFRHGGFIPWDHDLDLAIPTEEHARARVALADLGAHGLRAEDWSSYARPGTFIKLRVRSSSNFIDLYHHTLDAAARTVAYDFTFARSPIPASWKRGELTYTRPIALDVIFPLRRVRFEELEVWAPRDLEAYLHLKYGPDLGPTRRWDPRRRAWRRIDAHPYWRRIGS